MANTYAVRIRRRVLMEVYYLFVNYPAGVITMFGTTEPKKALRSVQRIATRLWEVVKPYQKTMRELEDLRVETLQPFEGQAEKFREICQEKIALRPKDERWKEECEHYRNTGLADLEKDKEDALYRAGYYHKLFAANHNTGMEYDEVELTKDLKETMQKCYEHYVEAKFDVALDPTPDDKEKKAEKKPKFVIKRRAGPFGGMEELPIEISRGAEAELEYALGDYSDEEEKDLTLRISQIWDGDRENDERVMKKIEERCGEIPAV